MSRRKGQRRRERILSKFHIQHRAQWGTWSHVPGIMTWTEIYWPSDPYTPNVPPLRLLNNDIGNKTQILFEFTICEKSNIFNSELLLFQGNPNYLYTVFWHLKKSDWSNSEFTISYLWSNFLYFENRRLF